MFSPISEIFVLVPVFKQTFQRRSFQTEASSIEAIKATHGGSGGGVCRGMAWIPQSLNPR